VTIAGFEHRWQVEAVLAALERERRGAASMNARHREMIDAQERIFRAELERMDREGDYVEPKGNPAMGTLLYVGRANP
jgi:hypothetical protein